MAKALTLTSQQKMVLWAVWDYARSRRGDDGRTPVLVADKLAKRYEDRFDVKMTPGELGWLADKRVLAREPDDCFRVANEAVVEAAYREIETALGW